MATEILFEEKQKFTQWWLWLLIIGLNTLLFYKIFIEKEYGNGSKTTGLIAMLVTFLLFILFYITNLKTRVYADRIEIRFFPFLNKWKKYPITTIEKMEVIEYNPIMDYGGWGLRLGAYNISGNKGLKIYYKKNTYVDSILIGTQKPEELSKIIKSIQNV